MEEVGWAGRGRWEGAATSASVRPSVRTSVKATNNPPSMLLKSALHRTPDTAMPENGAWGARLIQLHPGCPE